MQFGHNTGSGSCGKSAVHNRDWPKFRNAKVWSKNLAKCLAPQHAAIWPKFGKTSAKIWHHLWLHVFALATGVNLESVFLLLVTN